ncbi:M20/M25/M40 family metallo-hydrolase [Agromyces sp. NPDC055520]
MSALQRGEVTELLDALLRIDSSNPDLVPGAAGESRIAEYTVHWLSSRGFDVRLLEARSGRPSVVAIATGSGGGSSIMLNGHLDTVSLASYDGDGLAPVHRDGKIFARGAYDMKSGVAAIMVAAAAAAARPHRGDIIVTLVADEEYGSAGTEEVLRTVSADGAIVVEPSGLDLVVAHRGFAWFEVDVHGVAAHGSRPDLGVDAIVKAGRFLVELGKLDEALAIGPRHPLLGTGNVHASLISGGDEFSSYPARCTISLERRTVPGEDEATTEREVRGILDELARTDDAFRYELRTGLHRRPFAVDQDAPIVRIVAEQIEVVTGEPATTRGEPFWTDCALIADASIPAVLFGVDGGGAHAAEEWVDVASLHTVTRVLERSIGELCR